MRTSKIIITLVIVLSLAISTFFVVRNTTLMAFLRENVDFFSVYQNLGNPYIRYVYIPAGLRKEEVADIYSKTLAWNDQDVKEFLDPANKNKTSLEGYYYPSTYILPVDASGEEVKDKMLANFNKNVVVGTENKRSMLDKSKINIDTAIKIASLIQREAAGKQDMNLISGIIWNRIWKGMSLDIDATLQYAKGDDNAWWPQVVSADKNIASPYNTYKNSGLPPTPIANPSLAAIEAAYNPQRTDCIFYFHDKNHQIHCSKTYGEHKAGIEKYLR